MYAQQGRRATRQKPDRQASPERREAATQTHNVTEAPAIQLSALRALEQPTTRNRQLSAAQRALSSPGFAESRLEAHSPDNPAASGSGHAPIQRMKFKDDSGSFKTSKMVRNKLAKVVPVLRKVVHKFGDDKAKVTFKLINQGGPSPAYSAVDRQNGQATNNVVIELNNWYAERASVGDIIGMLVHELGVHGMADYHMGSRIDPTDPSKLSVAHSSAFLAERHTETGGHQLSDPALSKNYPLAAIDRAHPDRRQEDHVNVGKGLAAHPSGGQAGSRADVYVQTFLHAGDAIYDEQGLHPKAKFKRLKDLIHSFFFDIARIVATDDGKPLSMYKKSDDVAELMRFFNEKIVARYGQAHPWLKQKQLQPRPSGNDLKKHLRGLGGELAKSSNPTAQKVRGGLAGGLLAAGLWGFGATAAAPALAFGAAGGLAAWGAQKLFGY